MFAGKKHPRYGAAGGGLGLTLPSSNYIKVKVNWLWIAMKFPISFAFSKLVLDVKVKFLLISWHLSNQYFLQKKKNQLISQRYFHFDCTIAYQAPTWLLACLLLISVISSLSDPKKKLIFLGSQMAPSTKTRKFKSSKVYKQQNQSVLKQKEILLFWWRHQTTSINVIIGSLIVFYTKFLKVFVRSIFLNKQKK